MSSKVIGMATGVLVFADTSIHGVGVVRLYLLSHEIVLLILPYRTSVGSVSYSSLEYRLYRLVYQCFWSCAVAKPDI